MGNKPKSHYAGISGKKETNMKETKYNRKQTYSIILMVAAIVIVVIIIALLLRGCENRNKEPAATSTLQISSGIAYDSGAVQAPDIRCSKGGDNVRTV